MADKGSVTLDYRGNLLGAQFAFAGMSFLIDPADIDISTGLCADIVNCSIDYSYNVDRRSGSVRVASGNVTTAWANDTYIYCIKDNRLNTFNGTTFTQISNIVLANHVEFKQVNNIVVFSDNSVIGYIDGTTVVQLDHPSDWVDVTTLPTWVEDHYPADFSDPASNFEVDTFKLATLAGRCLEYFNGTLYFSIGNFIYCTKTFDIAHMDIRYSVVAGFPADVTMIARVNDGLFVGTTQGLYFLSGTGKKFDSEKGNLGLSFNQKQLTNYPVIYGTQYRVQADLVPQTKANNTVVLFATNLGVFAGHDGGLYTNLSTNQITMPYSSEGTAYFREANNIYQYVVCFNTANNLISGNAINPASLKDTWVVNTINSAHSRYTNFVYNSFFKYNNELYGSNTLGIYKLTGDIDYSGTTITNINPQIEAAITTPTIDFDKRQTKAVSDAYIYSRSYGDIIISVSVDEGELREGLHCHYDNREGLHRKRTKIPRGLKGSNWKFIVSNIDGSYFNIFGMDITAKTLKRTI